MPHNVFIGIDYSHKYHAVFVDAPDNTQTRFATNDPPADFLAACKFAYELAKEKGCAVFNLSSTTHFTMDLKGYRWDEDDMLIKDDQ